MFNDHEKGIAKNLCKSEETLKFLTKLFCPDRSKVRAELEKNIAALSDEDYGRAMKALVLQEAHFTAQMSELIRMGKESTGKAGAVAPK